jgi:hypothetical protein
MTVHAGGDGATFLPFGSMHRTRDGGRTWEDLDVRSDPQAYVGAMAVLPDGRLVVDVLAWSDQRINRMGSRPVGLHVTDGDDWAELLPVETGEPFDSSGSGESYPEVLATAASDDGVSVYALDRSDPHPHELFVSEDAGETWVSAAAR